VTNLWRRAIGEGGGRRCRAGRRVRIVALLAVPAALMGLASPAMAGKPTGVFVNFGDCPLSTTGVNLCLYAQTSSGEFVIGNRTVPITKTVTLQGGLILNEETGEETFVNAVDGNTLSKTPESVPGGLLGVVAPEILPPLVRAILNEFLSKGLVGVTATTELVEPVTINEKNLVLAEGAALTLPVRVHLENPFLGSACYIGSKLKPITLKLTTGVTKPEPPNEPIKGKIGDLKFKEGGALLIITENSLVDNAFAAPKAEGCGGLLSLAVDPAVNAELGLPAGDGHNTAILDGTLEQAAAEAVAASE